MEKLFIENFEKFVLVESERAKRTQVQRIFQLIYVHKASALKTISLNGDMNEVNISPLSGK